MWPKFICIVSGFYALWLLSKFNFFIMVYDSIALVWVVYLAVKILESMVLVEI
jgi:hypothetical protein